jgi:predicted DNA-binding transcriptional regulator AlpA
VIQPPSAPKILLTDEEAAAALGVSVRKFAELLHQPFMPRPLTLGPRLKRHVRAELEAAVASMPRLDAPGPEPAELLRGKIERQKRTLGTA